MIQINTAAYDAVLCSLNTTIQHVLCSIQELHMVARYQHEISQPYEPFVQLMQELQKEAEDLMRLKRHLQDSMERYEQTEYMLMKQFENVKDREELM